MHVTPSGLPGMTIPETNKRLRAELAKAGSDKNCGGIGV